ncbi:hypothetical protein B0H17DRAFT_1074121 [Mycena rosella]|uniref:Uncharacterized protein n=1 Tax=Mycena rosella TaxID=1033263 RepID=A0AAD7D7Q3_MYCRO|nr:hypothetical protein B0H17DRAFT_1074121 [Mycena rosella]
MLDHPSSVLFIRFNYSDGDMTFAVHLATDLPGHWQSLAARVERSAEHTMILAGAGALEMLFPMRRNGSKVNDELMRVAARYLLNLKSLLTMIMTQFAPLDWSFVLTKRLWSRSTSWYSFKKLKLIRTTSPFPKSSSNLHRRIPSAFPRKPLPLSFFHLLLDLDSSRHNHLPLALDFPTLQPRRVSQLSQRLLLNKTKAATRTIKPKRSLQRHGRVRDNPRDAMHHERVQQIHVADRTRHLFPILYDGGEERETVGVCWLGGPADVHPGRHTVWIVVLCRIVRTDRSDGKISAYQVPRYDTDAIGADRGPAPAWGDIAEDRDDEQRLLGGVEEVKEEVTVDMPSIEFSKGHGALPLLPEIDDEANYDEAVCPDLGLL